MFPEIKFFCSAWGLSAPHSSVTFTRLKAAGFDGIETAIPVAPEEACQLKQATGRASLDVIAHCYLASGDSYPVYLQRYKAEIEAAAAFGPALINSHTGKDFWPLEQNLELIDAAAKICARYGVPIVHETHRGRFAYSAVVTNQYLCQRPDLRLAADFSHWVCVSESMLQGQEQFLNLAIERTDHIHARVGFPEGPQVPDQFSPLWEAELAQFSTWWSAIAEKCCRAGQNSLSITPEYGPAPYAWVSPRLRPAFERLFGTKLGDEVLSSGAVRAQLERHSWPQRGGVSRLDDLLLRRRPRR